MKAHVRILRTDLTILLTVTICLHVFASRLCCATCYGTEMSRKIRRLPDSITPAHIGAPLPPLPPSHRTERAPRPGQVLPRHLSAEQSKRQRRTHSHSESGESDEVQLFSGGDDRTWTRSRFNRWNFGVNGPQSSSSAVRHAPGTFNGWKRLMADVPAPDGRRARA